MIFVGLHNLSTATRLKTTTKYKTAITYKNYENVIKEGITDLNNISDDIDLALINIKNLRLDFNQYKDCVEYNSMIKTLDELEYKLLLEYSALKEYNDRLNKALQKNNVKVKK